MKEQVLQIPKVDDWKPLPEDIIFTNAKGLILAPVAKTLQVESGGLDYFIMNSKKCYNSQTMRDHTCNYLNYFEKYYDTDHELLLVLFRIKYLIDTTPQYLQEDFVRDEVVYIINNQRLREKARAMVDNNYQLSLAYKNIPEALKYTDEHAKLMLCMSLFMNFCIPLITHYAYIHKIGIIDDFIMQTFDYILYMYPQVDIYNKLFATTYSNVTKSELKNAPIWAQQDIRGKDNITHSYASVSNIILNIMPKYTYDRSIISLNFTSIAKNTSCQILDIEYEFNYVSLSSSKRDEDNASDWDKFETNMIKQNESLFVQSKINSDETMRVIEARYGPFDPWEMEFYRQRLANNRGVIINSFQKQLIFNLFYKYFGDTVSIYGINSEDYIKLMLAAKKILLENHMIILPYIISGKVEKLIGRKTVNKKEMTKIQSYEYFNEIRDKYHNEKLEKHILSTIATIISSEFSIIDYNNIDIDKRMINASPDVIIVEVLQYTLLI